MNTKLEIDTIEEKWIKARFEIILTQAEAKLFRLPTDSLVLNLNTEQAQTLIDTVAGREGLERVYMELMKWTLPA